MEFKNIIIFACGLILTTMLATIHPAPTTTPTTTSPSAINDFLQMIPKDKLHDIAMSHLKSDEGFQAAIKYMQGSEFTALIDSLHKNEAWIKLKTFLKQLNINVDVLIHCVRSFLETAKVSKEPKVKPDLKLFLVDLSKIIPIQEIIAVWNAKMRQPDFQQFYEKISGPESRKLVEDALKTSDVKQLINVLDDMGMVFKQTLSALYLVMDWGNFEMPK